VISFDRQTPFQDAVEVINQFAQEFEDRFMIDRTGYTGNIGLTLPPDALERCSQLYC
jgi:general secretion pathway protein D